MVVIILLSIYWKIILFTLKNFHYQNEFYNKLGAAKTAIADTRNLNSDNPWYSNTTIDKVFLLSLDEVCPYFEDSTANLSKKCSYWIDDKSNSVGIAKYGSGNASWWWLRSHGSNSIYAAYFNNEGNVYVYGYNVNTDHGGVRPALWLNLYIYYANKDR